MTRYRAGRIALWTAFGLHALFSVINGLTFANAPEHQWAWVNFTLTSTLTVILGVALWGTARVRR